jgi:hypothetical protein
LDEIAKPVRNRGEVDVVVRNDEIYLRLDFRHPATDTVEWDFAGT